ncbi:MAG: acyl-CoA dehydrogenase family protein [Nitrospirae bacterium]|nr:acyl-CoA dehydrogenase family protein [Nitrospirota bacterium]
MSEPTSPKGCAFLVEPFGSVPIFTPEDFTEEDRALARAAHDFMSEEVIPRHEEIERKQEGVMVELLKKAGRNGFLSAEVPEAYGGLGFSKALGMRLSEEFARMSSFAVALGAHTGIGTLPLVYYGTEEQRRKYLPRLASGELIAAYALTEPQAGTDALAAKTTAVLDADGRQYLLTGVKQFITNAGFADLFTVFAKIDGREFTAFLVERATPGVSVGREEHKLGIEGSSTRQVILENARVPVENLLGERGRGHKIAFNILNVGRLKLGGGSIGTAKECLEIATRYAKERRQFGRPIAEFGVIHQKLADMATRIFVADSINYRAAGFVDALLKTLDKDSPDYFKRASAAIEEFTVECSISKVFGTEALNFVADEALQILGGYGFLRDYPIERYYRDARINRIFEGTNEINRLIIPSTLLKRAMEGIIPLMEFVQQAQEELAGSRSLAIPEGPLRREAEAVVRSKRILAYVANLMVQKHMADLKDQQQHLQIFSNMIIDLFAMDCATLRAERILREKGENGTKVYRDMCHAFVASGNDRILANARRLLANDMEDLELRGHLDVIGRFAPFLPVRTIQIKTDIARQVVDMDGRLFA